MKPIPSLQTIFNNVSATLRGRLKLLVTALKLVADALAAVWSGQLWLAYLYLQDIQRNLFPDTADPAEEGGTLGRFGKIYLNRDKFPATEGYYTATVNGLAGATLRAGLTWKSNDDSRSPGFLYSLDNAYTLTGANDVITLRAMNAGKAYQLDVGDALTATEPLIGVDQECTIATMTVQPTEAETTEDYRQKILDAIVIETQGGARGDYRIWAYDAPGVRKVYPYVKQTDAGVVQVYVEATSVDSTDGFGTPSQAMRDNVKDVIEMDPDTTLATNDRGRIPMQAGLEVLPVSVRPVDIVITGLQVNTTAVQNDIEAALNAFLYTVRPYIAGPDLARDKNDVLTSVKAQSVVTDAIGNANTFLGFTLNVNGVQVQTYTFNLGNIPYLNSVTYN